MPTAFIAPNAHHGALRALNYTPEVEALRSKSGASRPLGKLLVSMGPVYGAVFTRIDCDPEAGIELLSQGDMFAAEPQGRVIRLDSMAKPEKHRIQRWQVLIAGAGTLGENELYGRSIIADGRLEGRYVGPHAMALTFLEPGSDINLFAYAFLCSKIGVRALRSASYGTKILGIRKDLLSELPIPVVDEATQRRVASLIRRSVEQREKFQKELEAARQLIEALPEVREAHSMCANRRARAVLWRGTMKTLCAWNTASLGDALGRLQRAWRSRIADALEPGGVFNGPRFARVDCDSPFGIPFMSQRDVFLMRPVARRIVKPAIPDRLLFVPRTALLAGSHGQLNDGSLFGRVELASFGAWEGGVTQDILRLLFKPEHRLVAYAFLSSTVGLRLLQSTAVGTSIPSMHLALLNDLPFPELDSSLTARVHKHVIACESARIDAGMAEAEAIRIIEQEVLPTWLA